MTVPLSSCEGPNGAPGPLAARALVGPTVGPLALPLHVATSVTTALFDEPMLHRRLSSFPCLGRLLMHLSPCRTERSTFPSLPSTTTAVPLTAAGECHPFLSSCLAAMRWPISCCSAGAPKLSEACGEDLPWFWPMLAHLRPCHRGRRALRDGATCAPAASAPCPVGRPHTVLGHASQAVSTLLAWASGPRYIVYAGPHMAFTPLARSGMEIPFLFLFGLNSSSIFKNSYLSIQSSKNHETSSAGFVN
jgi:hypothetical protein